MRYVFDLPPCLSAVNAKVKKLTFACITCCFDDQRHLFFANAP